MDDNQRMWEDRYASGGSSPDGAQPHPEVAGCLGAELQCHLRRE